MYLESVSDLNSKLYELMGMGFLSSLEGLAKEV